MTSASLSILNTTPPRAKTLWSISSLAKMVQEPSIERHFNESNARACMIVIVDLRICLNAL